MELARSPIDARDHRRAEYERALQTDNGSHRLRQNKRNRAAVIDIARVDIADSLASSVTSDIGDNALEGDSSRRETSEFGSPEANRVTALAEAMTRATWAEIANEIGDTPDALNVKRDLAKHGWCDLLVGMIQAIESLNKAIQMIPDEAKTDIKRAILNSTMQGGRARVTSEIVDVVVDRVWQALLVQVPLLGIDTEQTLRALRILAVFICPAPESHKEVRVHALKPLGDDAREILSSKTKDRLTELFADWQSNVNNE